MHIALIVISVLFVAFCVALYAAYRVAYHVSPRQRKKGEELPLGDQYEQKRPEMARLTREMMADSYEEVWITAWDGTRLMGRYYHVMDDAPLQLQFHGYRGSAYRDFCGGHQLAKELRHNSIVVDQRAHGASEGNMICFGIRERKDCLDWANYAANRFGARTPLILSGVSMGAATVLMASDLPLRENVVGIIADCPYSAPAEIIRKVCGDMRLPKAIAYPLVKLAARVIGGLDLDESSAIDSVKKTKLPILILHGEADHFVPCQMSRQIQWVNPQCVQLETFPDAGHGLSFMTDPLRYREATQEFIKKLLQ